MEVDCSLMTVDQFVDHPIKRGLGFNQPSLLFNSSIIHEEGEEAEDVGYGSSLLQVYFYLFIQTLIDILCRKWGLGMAAA